MSDLCTYAFPSDLRSARTREPIGFADTIERGLTVYPCRIAIIDTGSAVIHTRTSKGFYYKWHRRISISAAYLSFFDGVYDP